MQKKEVDGDLMKGTVQKKTKFENNVQRKCASCEEEEKKVQLKCSTCEQEKEEKIQTKPAIAATDNKALLESSLASSKGSGKVMNARVQTEMESSFGADFSAVRIHDDNTAVQMSNDLNAQAFTHGNDIYFNAGKYNTNSTAGKHLLAHELTHTIQQGGGTQMPKLQSYSLDEFTSDVSDAKAAVEDGLSNAADTVVETAETVGGVVYDTAVDAGEAIYDTAKVVGGGIYDAGETVVTTAVDMATTAFDWLATQAGEAAKALADFLGGYISITTAGIEIHIPGGCPFDALTHEFTLDTIDKEFMVPVFAIPVGPDIFLSGEIGITGGITPEVQVQLGPLCFDPIHIIINPLTQSYSISGGMSITSAMSVAAELTAGLKAELSLTAIVPVGPVPVPISVPLLGAEGGVAVLLRGIAAETYHTSNVLSYNNGSITASPNLMMDMGLGADLFAGAYAQLSVLGKNLCRIYWQPYEWHAGIASSLGLSGDISLSPGFSVPDINVNPPTLEEIPFDDIPLAIDRHGFTDDCPLVDALCELLTDFGLLPSQNGGTWDWAANGHGGTYGPGNRLTGPMDVYEKNPGIKGDGECRGACGVSCNTCEAHPVYIYTDAVTGDVWEYKNFQDCNSHTGCRDHDAAFDWAADVHDETGDLAIIYPWHMAANIECGCNNLGGNCVGWVLGLPPYDMKMYFADSATQIASGGGLPPIPPGGGGSMGNTPTGNEEEDLASCDRHELPPDYCDELENRIIERFGNRDRNIDFNPDTDVDESRRRVDDTPASTQFRLLYNRLDSWNIYIRRVHPNWQQEFNDRFHLVETRAQWMDEMKQRTKEYKAQFRDLRTQDTERLVREFETNILNEMAGRINRLNVEIAEWYIAKSGSRETVAEVIERIHIEATELWRTEWRAAIFAVNRILSRLWPVAKINIQTWVAVQRGIHVGEDLTGAIGDIDYIGSLATGYKGAPKQYVRFNPEKFDVDANIEAPPLSKFAMNIIGILPDRNRIFAIGAATHIDPLIDFCHTAGAELAAVDGYDTTDAFDVVIKAPNTAGQTRSNTATERVYTLRSVLIGSRYYQMVNELRAVGLLSDENGDWQVKAELSRTETQRFNSILSRYES